MQDDFLVSAHGDIVEPPDLYSTRLPRHLRERAMWEEDFEIEPIGDDGYTHFSKLLYRDVVVRTPQGWRIKHKSFKQPRCSERPSGMNLTKALTQAPR